MAFTLLQMKAAVTAASQNHTDVTLDNPTTAGSLIAVLSGNTTSFTVTGVTDGGDTFVQATGAAGTAIALAFATDVWYILAGAGGLSTVVCTFSGSNASSKSIWVFEFSYTGTASFDGAAGTTAAAGVSNVDTGAAVTTSSTNGALVSNCLTQGGITAINSGNEFTIGPITTNSDASAYLISSAATTHTPQWSDSQFAPVICSSTAAFKASGASAGPPIDDDVFLPWNRPVIPEPSLMVFG